MVDSESFLGAVWSCTLRSDVMFAWAYQDPKQGCVGLG